MNRSVADVTITYLNRMNKKVISVADTKDVDDIYRMCLSRRVLKWKGYDFDDIKDRIFAALKHSKKFQRVSQFSFLKL